MIVVSLINLKLPNFKMLNNTGICLEAKLLLTKVPCHQYFLHYPESINYPDSVFSRPDDDGLLFNEIYVQGELDVMFSELYAHLVGKSGDLKFYLINWF